jgi:hypothetical protein
MSLPLSTDETDVGLWELKQGESTLAFLEQTFADFPWVECSIYPAPAFKTFRHLFTRKESLWRGRETELHKLIAEAGVRLLAHDGQPVVAFTLLVEGTAARLTFTQV